MKLDVYLVILRIKQKKSTPEGADFLWILMVLIVSVKAPYFTGHLSENRLCEGHE